MDKKVYEPVSIELKMHGLTHRVEGLSWDSPADELKEAFEYLLVAAGFSPSVIEVEDGHYEFIPDDEEDY